MYDHIIRISGLTITGGLPFQRLSRWFNHYEVAFPIRCEYKHEQYFSIQTTPISHVICVISIRKIMYTHVKEIAKQRTQCDSTEEAYVYMYTSNIHICTNVRLYACPTVRMYLCTIRTDVRIIGGLGRSGMWMHVDVCVYVCT